MKVEGMTKNMVQAFEKEYERLPKTGARRTCAGKIRRTCGS